MFSKFKKGFSGIVALVYLLAITRTRSRMGFLGLAIFLAQFAWIKRKKPVVILLLGILVVFTFMNTHYGYLERVRGIDRQEAEHSRIKLWRQAVELIKLRPLFGVGPGNFVRGKAYFGIKGDVDHIAHITYLDIGAEVGVMASIIYVLIIISSLISLSTAQRKAKEQHSFEILSICQAIRMAFITLSFMMLFMSDQYNNFYYIFSALSVVLRNFGTEKEKIRA